VHPPEGDALYGDGHSAAGFAAGRDAVVVYERARGLFAPVLAAAVPLAGWNHVAVVYRDGTPSLYVNGQLVKSGLRTGRTVHPGLGSPDANIRFVHFEGDMTAPALVHEALGEARLRELAAKLPDPDARLPSNHGPAACCSGRTVNTSCSTEPGARRSPDSPGCRARSSWTGHGD